LRVGIYGGVFNPPHVGHLICAQEAVEQLELDRLLIVPVGDAPHREIESDPGAGVRLRMCELAFVPDERLEVSRVEIDREGPSYTVDTLRRLSVREPDSHFFLVMGGDQAAALASWREPEEVLRLANVACVEREGARREEIRSGVAELAGAEFVRFLDMPRIDVSSTLIRRRVAEGRPIRHLVPDAVAGFVEERGLYRGAAVAGAPE